MKRFMLFAISFVVLFSSFQVVSGMILTLVYTPDVESAWGMSANLSQETVMMGSGSFSITLLIAFLAAAIAYWIQHVMNKKFSTN